MDNITLDITFSKWLEGKVSLDYLLECKRICNYILIDPEVANNGVDNTIP
jgi:hypothetical protein